MAEHDDATTRSHRPRPGGRRTAASRLRAGRRRARDRHWPLLKRTFKEFSGGQPHGLGRGAHLLQPDVALSGADRDGRDRRPRLRPPGGDEAITDVVDAAGPELRGRHLRGPDRVVTSNQAASGILFVVGVLVALNAASGYVGAFIRASNIIWETPEGRGFFKLRPLQIGVTLAMILMLVIVALGLILTGPLVEAVGSAIGVGDTALTVWDIANGRSSSPSSCSCSASSTTPRPT